MPNWVDTSWEVTLPTDKVTRFLNYFLTSDDRDKLRGKFLYRTFIVEESVNVTETSKGISFLSFVSDSAWSLGSIFETGKEDKYGVSRCIGLEDLCKDCEVISLTARGDEPMMGFREFIEYEQGEDLCYNSEEVTPWMCEKCHTMGYWEDEDSNADRTICPSCKEKFEEEEDE